MKRWAAPSIASPTDTSTTREPLSSPRLLSLLLPTAIALYANFQGVQMILVPAQVEALDPARKIGHLALLTLFCAITGSAV